MSAHFTVEFTFYWWWLWAYLAVGVVLFVPVNWLGNRLSSPRRPLWQRLWPIIKRKPWIVLLQVVGWPISLFELRR